MIMRPDEKAVESEIQRDQDFRSHVSKGVATAATLGTGAATAGAATKILPWLSKYIPADLAMKGLSKVSPKLADFLKRGQSAGLNIEDGIQYIKDQFTNSEKGEKNNGENPKEQRNIIEQYDPELYTYMSMKVKEGMSPLEAGQKALGHGRFKNAVDKMTKDHKASWSAIIQSVFKMEGQQQPKQQMQQQQQMAQPQAMQQQTPQGQQGQQPGQGASKLLDILNKLKEARGA